MSSDQKETVDSNATIGLLDRLLDEIRAGRPIDAESIAQEFQERVETVHEMLAVVRLVNQATEEINPSVDLDARVHASAQKPVLGDFRIEREIGRGGMGIVYEATQLSLNRRVALKVLQPGVSISSRALKRFNREARTAGSLHHTHIVPVYGVGQCDGVYYYAMQFIEGRSLAAFIRQARAESPTTDDGYFRRVARWGLQMADALEYAHERGVVHRDIKPANIMRDRDDNIWLTDFGLARHDDATTITQSEDMIGTARYMSPEAARGGATPVDERADVYALGVTLYELATLKPPFDGEDRETILRNVLNEPPRPPRRVNPALPKSLETIILKAIEKAPERRYVCAALMAEDLRRFLAGETLLTQPPGFFETTRRLLGRRRPLARLFSGAVLALSIAGVLAAGWLANRAARLEDQLQVERHTRLAAEETHRREVENLRARVAPEPGDQP